MFNPSKKMNNHIPVNNLFEKMSEIKTTNPYFSKDVLKAKHATKFIGRGSAASSTNKYMLAAGKLANCGQYDSNDIIFVSVEGQRMGRMEPDFEELDLAINAKATFVMDNEADRSRPYNTGERQVAFYLKKHEYMDTNGNGIWKPLENK